LPVLQVELHPYLTQEPLLKFAKQLGIAVTAYSSFGPQSYVELSMDRGAPSLLEHDLVGNIASSKGKSASFLFFQGAVVFASYRNGY
jgi:D-xylose reductase